MVRFGEILIKLVDGTQHTPKYTNSGITFISVKNISNVKLDFKDTKFISENEHNILFKRCTSEKNDLLLSKIGTTGVPVKVDTNKSFSLFVSVALLKLNNQMMYINFLIYTILSPTIQKQCKKI